MKFHFKSFIFLVSSFWFLVSGLLFPISALAQTKWSENDSKCVASTNDDEVATIQGVECLFANILQVIVSIAGIAFLFMFIIGGYQYLFSGNDPKKVAAASSTLTMSIIGLVGIIVSFFIIKFIQNFTGINVMDFVIPDPA